MIRGFQYDPMIDVETAIEELRQGKMLIVTDSKSRENEGDLIAAAESMTSQQVNFMAQYARGLICVPLTLERAEKLDLKPMVQQNEDIRRTAFTVSVDAKDNISTGISAHDRYQTIKLLASDEAKDKDFVRPGHIFPLVARTGGVIVRAGHTEAAVDLCRLAGKKPVGVICEIMNSDGSMSRMNDLKKMARKHNLKIVTIESLIEYRRRIEKTIEKIRRETWASPWGELTVYAFRTPSDGRTHIALVKGEINSENTINVRVHSECFWGDTFSEAKKIPAALTTLQQSEPFIFVYVAERAERRSIFPWLSNKEEDELLRDYGVGAQILTELGACKIKVFTNNPRPIAALDGFGLELIDTVVLPYGKKGK